MSKSSKRKGVAGELEVCKLLKDNGYKAQRGQFHPAPDIIHDMDGIHIEVKRSENLRPWNAIAQANQFVEGTDMIPTVWFRRSREKWHVIISAEEFINLCKDAGR